MRKILVAMPLKRGLDYCSLPGLVDLLRADIPDTRIEFAPLEGASVNFARNELANRALAMGVDDLVFIDSDLAWTLDHFKRLISHRQLEVVGGVYAKKKPGPPQWLLQPPEGGLKPTEEICEVRGIATGFLKIRVNPVFRSLMVMYPHLEYTLSGEPDSPTAFEFFPMGVVGPRTPEARLKEIKRWVDSGCASMNDIRDAIYAKHPPGRLTGEDYYFCNLCRGAGIKIYADLAMPILPHVGDAEYPIIECQPPASGDVA